MTLAEHIADCMRESKLRTGDGGPCYNNLVAGMRSDTYLRSQALATIQEGTPLERRDHITRWRSDLLRRALQEANDVSPNV